MTAFRTFALWCFDVDFDAEGGAERQIVDGTMNGFIGCHLMSAVGTGHASPLVSMNGRLDIFGRKCYLVDDETFETEEFVDAFNFHDAILENANNSFLALNHCNA